MAELPTKSIEELREIEREIKMGRNESALLGDLRAVGEQQADARSMLVIKWKMQRRILKNVNDWKILTKVGYHDRGS